MSSGPPLTLTADAERIGWLVFGAAGVGPNVLDEPTLAALDATLDRVARENLAALVIGGAGDRIFLAGADLKRIAALPDAAAAAEFARRGQRLFQRIAELRLPVVCAIHGACAGGGLELALACHWRIASDAAVTRIGLPETSLGTIPGWGGCVRLPRLIGVKPALEHILAGRLLDASAAARAGLVNDVAAAEELRNRARAAALRLAHEGVPPHPPRAASMPGVFAELRQTVLARTRGHEPAPLAAIDAVEQTAQLPTAAALDIEARIFGEVTAGQTCKNLIRFFFLREAAKKRTLAGWFEGRAGAGARFSRGASPSVKGGPKPALPRRVGLVGAGVMGSGIAHWLAAHGCEVAWRDIDQGLLDRGLTVVRGLCDEAVQRGKLAAGAANAALHRIRTTTGWDGFDACDLVIEAIVEDAEAKRRLFSELAAVVRADAVLASNTSALPIEEIAGHVPRPGRTVGIHFFNPVSRMPLVELIIGRETSADTAERALALVKALGKSPVICRSSPGFLVTRVLFFYLNEAVRFWEQGLSTAAIDEALREFGWPMGPLRLIDEVGIDVTELIFGELAHYFPERFVRTSATAQLLAAGLKGRKNGASTGFYTYAPREAGNDPMTRQVAGRRGELTLSREQITAQLMGVLAREAQRCVDERVVASPDDVDFALLSGAGFPARRGGLMHRGNFAFGQT